MIRVKMTPGMLAIVPATVRIDRSRVVATRADLETIAAIFDELTTTAADGRTRQTAKHAAKRIRDAFAKRDAHRVPISITVEEQEALEALAGDPDASIALDVGARLARRDLAHASLEGWMLTARGRAVNDGTPPGDLVPFAYFEEGTSNHAPIRVRLIWDTTEDEHGREVAAGTELIAFGASDGAIALSFPSKPRDCVLANVSPKIVLVVGPS